MKHILTEEEMKEYIEKIKKYDKLFLIPKFINAAKEVNELRKKLQRIDIAENSILEKQENLNKREKDIIEKETYVSKLLDDYSKKEADIKTKQIDIRVTEETFKKTKETLEKLLEDVSKEKLMLITDFEKKAKETYALRSEAIENEINQKQSAAQAEYVSIIKHANELSEKIKKSAQEEYDSIIKQANVIKDDTQKKCDNIQVCIAEKEKLEIENTELNTKAGTIDSLIKEKAEVEAENAKLKSELETTKKTNETLTERTRKFEEYEILDKTLQSAELSINSVIESIKNLETNKQKLQQEKEELKKNQDSLSIDKKRLDNKEIILKEREEKLNEEVEEKVANENVVREQELITLRNQLEELKTICTQKDDVVTLMENIKQRLGEDPAIALAKIANYDANMKQLEEEIAKLPSYMMKRKMEDLKQQEEILEQKEAELDKKIKEKEQDIKENASLKIQNADLQKKCDEKDKDISIIKGELERLRSTYDNPQGQQERVEQINIPCEGFENAPDKLSEDEYPKSEQEWLSKVKKKIKESGFIFPNRIVDAFHTALKTAEMSPLTVLAGVSGTGKSKLPEYYARFGGINFLSVPVQPNWDCQESMTGFYNSIDNCFEPTQILRLLAQTQREPNNQNGLNDVMTMILLDEMNLANIELYFAEFLSKLETRRGHYSEEDIPSVWIKLGASKGIKKWPLKLGRNVLWTGTMNQDETTKTLSDKVLDRGIVINFPRPDKFEPLPKTKLIKEEPLLPKHIWESWVNNNYDFYKNETLNKLLQEKKEQIENINRELGRAGRALGHRVWQSVELYMSLYPGVVSANDDSNRKVAMEKAFEDQLVQKVMPKLRGIETRGIQGDVLDKIKGYIPETLHEDYENAKEQGYGQFMWISSNYLLREEKLSSINNKEEKISNINSDEQVEDSEKNIYENLNLDSKEGKLIKKILELINSNELEKDKTKIEQYIEGHEFSGNDIKRIRKKVFNILKEENTENNN